MRLKWKIHMVHTDFELGLELDSAEVRGIFLRRAGVGPGGV